MRRVILFAAFMTAFAGVVAASPVDTVYISTMSTTHIRFSSELKYVDLSNRVISARIVEGSKDIVAVKAKEIFDFKTTMSCLEADGNLHTFIVAYDDSPKELIIDTKRKAPVKPEIPAETSVRDTLSVFEQLSQMERGIYHIGDVGYDIKVLCENIVIRNDMTYIVISVENSSGVSYGLSSPRFVIESKRKTKRGLVYEKQVFPKHTSGEDLTSPGTKSVLVFNFDKVTLGKGQVFRIYLYEDNGPRNYVLNFSMADLNRAEVR